MKIVLFAILMVLISGCATKRDLHCKEGFVHEWFSTDLYPYHYYVKVEPEIKCRH